LMGLGARHWAYTEWLRGAAAVAESR
jgi:hypothetical protein